MKIKVTTVTKISLSDWLDQESRTLHILKLRDGEWLAKSTKGDNADWANDSWMGKSPMDAVRKAVQALNTFQNVEYSIYISSADTRKIERAIK